MKKYLLFALSGLMLASCSESEFLNEEAIEDSKNQPIEFLTNNPTITRGTSVGAEAAAKLNNHFVVYATKHYSAEDGTATNDMVVFNQYNVIWKDDSQGSLPSNTSGWDYVDSISYNSAIGKQGIKYWDYGADNGYTFYAFSSKDISYPADPAKDRVQVTKVTADPASTDQSVYKKGYTVNLGEGATISDVFFSDRNVVETGNFGSPVTMTFRRLGTKVRVGFYETIPGYSVTIDTFFYDTDATAAVTKFKDMNTASAGKDAAFKAALQNVKGDAESKVVTVIYNDGSADPSAKEQATVVNSTVTYDYTLTLGTNIVGTTLGTTAATATFDTNGADSYTSVYPNEAVNQPMLIRCSYTLTALDSGGETIKVKNARVVVPVQYMKWKSNYSYTYLFKITDRTNGTSGKVPSDPDNPDTGKEGLYPITFDAVAVGTDGYAQDTYTIVATNSVTSFSAAQFKKDNAVYVVNMDVAKDTVIVPKAIGDSDGQAQIYTVTSTSENISEASILAKLTGTSNGLTLTALSAEQVATLVSQVPNSDGTYYTFGTDEKPAAVKFTPTSKSEAKSTYAYVYCTTKYVAPSYKAADDSYSSSTTYYFKTTSGVYYLASQISAANYAANKANLYTQTSAGTAGVYDVKVITITE